MTALPRSARIFGAVFAVLICIGTLLGSHALADTNFTVTAGQWNDPTSWTSGVPTNSTGITTIANGGTAIYDSSMGTMSFGGGEFHLGDGRVGNTVNTLNVTGGTLTRSSGEALIGFGFAKSVTAYLNVSGGTFDNQSNGLTLGWLGGSGQSNGYVNISGGGQVNTGELRDGSGPGGIGHIDIAASGGTLTAGNGGTPVSIGFDSATAGYLTQEGGTFVANGQLIVGNGAVGQLTISGGQITDHSDLYLGANYNGHNGTGTFTQSGVR